MKNIVLADYQIHVGSIWEALKEFLNSNDYSSVIVLVDDNTYRYCLPLLHQYLDTPSINIIRIPAGETHKHITTCQYIWEEMMKLEVDRKALMVNLGGGVIGDMGGFCASTYKRGIDFIQIPTTLLSQVDASIGGKLGVDFGQVKNSIGLFKNPKAVFIDPIFHKTLPKRELRSGYAEIIKHSLIADISQWEAIQQIKDLSTIDFTQLIEPSLQIKKQIVESDPFEKGLRKALNFGHTIGHAVEGILLETAKPLLHGEAIAIGMICESYLSHKILDLPKEALQKISRYLLQIYDRTPIPEAKFSAFIQLMQNDKKNEGNSINFSLINPVGTAVINQTADHSLILDSLHYYNKLVAVYPVGNR